MTEDNRSDKQIEKDLKVLINSSTELFSSDILKIVTKLAASKRTAREKYKVWKAFVSAQSDVDEEEEYGPNSGYQEAEKKSPPPSPPSPPKKTPKKKREKVISEEEIDVGLANGALKPRSPQKTKEERAEELSPLALKKKPGKQAQPDIRDVAGALGVPGRTVKPKETLIKEIVKVEEAKGVEVDLSKPVKKIKRKDDSEPEEEPKTKPKKPTTPKKPKTTIKPLSISSELELEIPAPAAPPKAKPLSVEDMKDALRNKGIRDLSVATNEEIKSIYQVVMGGNATFCDGDDACPKDKWCDITSLPGVCSDQKGSKEGYKRFSYKKGDKSFQMMGTEVAQKTFQDRLKEYNKAKKTETKSVKVIEQKVSETVGVKPVTKPQPPTKSVDKLKEQVAEVVGAKKVPPPLPPRPPAKAVKQIRESIEQVAGELGDLAINFPASDDETEVEEKSVKKVVKAVSETVGIKPAPLTKPKAKAIEEITRGVEDLKIGLDIGDIGDIGDIDLSNLKLGDDDKPTKKDKKKNKKKDDEPVELDEEEKVKQRRGQDKVGSGEVQKIINDITGGGKEVAEFNNVQNAVLKCLGLIPA